MRRRWSRSHAFTPWLAALILAGCTDLDGDGKTGGRDCDDTNPAVHKKAPEVCDGVDNDCDGLVDEDVAIVAYLDRDGDGFGDDGFVRRVCELPANGSTVGGDCDDEASGIHPDAVEVCDGIDNDCSGTIDEDVTVAFFVDADGDGSGAGAAVETGDCWPPDGYSLDDADCDDADPLRAPQLAEICDGIDNDCDQDVDEELPDVPVYTDADGDGSGDPSTRSWACGAVGGRVTDGRDCDDADPDVGAFAVDISGSGVDEDCDGYVDELGIPSLYPDLDAALQAAEPNAVIQFEDGMFAVNADLRGEAVRIAGNGCEHTTLFGSFAGSVLHMDGGAVENLTIANGGGTPWPWAGQSTTHFGGGLFVSSGHVNVSNACFVSNSTNGAGGAIAVLRDGSVTVSDSTFESNAATRAGGAIYGERAQITVLRSRFLDNRSGNWRGGAIGLLGGHLEAQGSLFAHNSSEDGGGTLALMPVGSNHDPGNIPELLEEPATAFLSHLTIHGSFTTSNTESAIYLKGATLEMEHSIVTGSDGNADPGNVFFSSSYDRVDTGERVRSELDLTNLGLLHAADYEELGFGGGWVISAQRGDPRYVDADAGDLRLLADSPFRDLAPGQDADGTPSDLGAFSGPWALPDGLPVDAEADGLDDLWERHHGLDPTRDDSAEDPDGDGLDNLGESLVGSDPNRMDTDGDTVSDADEMLQGTDPQEPRDQQPTADAGRDRLVLVGQTVQLDSSASFDPNDDPLGVTWTLQSAPVGSTASISGTSFVPDIDGIYTVVLTVDDGAATDEHTVVVEALTGVLIDSTEALHTAAAELSTTVIALAPGTYEDVFVYRPEGELTLFGTDTDAVVLVPRPDHPAIFGGGASMRVAQLTVEGGTQSDGLGLERSGGGAVFFNVTNPSLDVTLTLERLRFVGSEADGNGGAVFAQNVDDTVLADVDFVGCSADKGAALYSYDGPVHAERITVHGCSADEGVLYLRTATSTHPVIFDDLWLVENQARNLVHLEFTADLQLTHGLWLGNRAQRAVWFDSYNGVATMVGKEVLFERNTFAGDAGPLAAMDGATFQVWLHELQQRDVERMVSSYDAEAELLPTTADLRAGRFIPDGVYDDLILPRLGSSVFDAGWLGYTDFDGSRSDHAVRPRRPRDVRWKLDADADGMSDGWEVHYGLDPYSDDGALDPDGDGLMNVDEHAAGTDPTQADTDADGVDDATEVDAGDTDPLDPFDNRPIAVLAAAPTGLFEGDVIQLDGSASWDPNDTPLTFHWTVLEVPPGSTLTSDDLLPADSATPSLTADARGTWRFELVVDDGLLLSEPVEIEVFVKGTLAVPSVYGVDEAFALVTDGETVAFETGTFDLPPVTTSGNLTLQGTGATILRAAPASRHITIEPQGNLVLQDLELHGGIGTTGGAVYCDRGTLSATAVRLVDNKATYGGALYLDQCDANLLDVELVGNEALFNGGGLVTRNADLTWIGGSAVDNVAGDRGGGLYADLFNVLYPEKVSLSELVIANNQAADGGSAYFKGARVDAQHLTVIDNVAPNDRGGLTFIDSQPTVTASILARNTGPQVRLFEVIPLPETFDGVIAWRPQAPGNWYQANAQPGPLVLAVDPLLAEGPRPLLRYGSPAIDLASDLDPDGSPGDAGAYGGPHAPPDYRTYYLDEDADLLADAWEATYGVDDDGLDADADGLSNGEEHQLGTDPTDPDTDGDGVGDDIEIGGGSDPLDPDDHRPLAFPGFDVVVDPGVEVTLDGQFSADPNGDDLTYTWSLVEQPGRSTRTPADLVPSGDSRAVFTPDVPGAFVFELVVNDGTVDSLPARVTARVNGMVRVPEDYPSVVDAVWAVAPDGRVEIGAGTWPAAGIVLNGKNVAIGGAGRGSTVLDAGSGGRLLEGSVGEAVLLESLTTTGGRAMLGGSVLSQGVNSGQPGGVRAVLELVDVELAANQAVRGGALFTEDADVFLTQVRVVDNGAAHEGGGVAADFVALEAANVLWAGNVSTYADGGGLHLDRSTFFGRNLVFSDNAAGTYGGGFATDGVSIPTSFDLRFVTATHNQAVANGGFAYLRYLDPSVLSHALVVANGGAALAKSSTTVTLDVDHSWFHGNVQGPYSPVNLPASELAVSTTPSGLLHSDDGDWTNDTWELPAGSPASDSGDPGLGLLDADGSALDPGAFGGPGALPL